jgi:hypothetical protein
MAQAELFIRLGTADKEWVILAGGAQRKRTVAQRLRRCDARRTLGASP